MVKCRQFYLTWTFFTTAVTDLPSPQSRNLSLATSTLVKQHYAHFLTRFKCALSTLICCPRFCSKNFPWMAVVQKRAKPSIFCGSSPPPSQPPDWAEISSGLDIDIGHRQGWTKLQNTWIKTLSLGQDVEQSNQNILLILDEYQTMQVTKSLDLENKT